MSFAAAFSAMAGRYWRTVILSRREAVFPYLVKGGGG